MDIPSRFDNLGRSLAPASRTVSGNTPLRLVFQGAEAERLGVLVHNHSATLRLFLKLSRLTAGESVSATDKHLVLQPEASALIRAGGAVEIWALNSSGDGTASAIDAVEVR